MLKPKKIKVKLIKNTLRSKSTNLRLPQRKGRRSNNQNR